MKITGLALVCMALATTCFTADSINDLSTGLGLAKSGPKIAPKPISICVPAYDSTQAEPEIPALSGWGNYHWKITTDSDSARFYFDQGINMYFAFHTIEAIASFAKATRFDPQSAMAWYGKSLSLGPTINYPNGYAPPADAYEASVNSRKWMGACTPLEKELINAMKQRFSEDTTITVKQLRINYAEAMQQVYAKYPKNADVVTLYADALLLLHPWDLYEHDFKPKPWTPAIRKLLEEALTISPEHPGANHYYIHTLEASATPEQALKSAHLLDTMMPMVSHMTHMPSHIYIRTGNFQQGIVNNDAAVNGYNGYAKQFAPVMNGFLLYQLHNVHLKINCAQMAGNYKMASDASDSLKASIPPFFLSIGGADGNLIQYVYMQPTLTAVRFGKWDEILADETVDTLSYAAVLSHFARGLAFCKKGDAAKARAELSALENAMKDPDLKIPLDNFSNAFECSEVARLTLSGVIFETEKQHDTAVKTLKKAVIAEDKLIYNEPRDWPIPARHYLGNVLLKAGKYPDAIAVLKKDLTINPNNGWSLTGLKLAYENSGNQKALANINQRLKAAWKIKDMPIPGPVL